MISLPITRHRVWQLIADGVLVVAAWRLAFFLRFDTTVPVYYRHLLSWRVVLLVVLINLTVFVQNGNHPTGRLYAYEVCDACEDDSFGYLIERVLVSDFVYPSWFESFRKSQSTVFDYQKHTTKAFELLKGGYIGYFDVTGGSGWQQETKDKRLDYRARPRVGSRRERRRTPRDQWQASEVVPIARRGASLAKA